MNIILRQIKIISLKSSKMWTQMAWCSFLPKKTEALQNKKPSEYCIKMVILEIPDCKNFLSGTVHVMVCHN